MTRLIEPAGVFLDELLVADIPPRTNAGGIAVKIAINSSRAVIGGSFPRELDRYIRIALARCKTVAHAGNQNVPHLDVGLGNFKSANLDADGHAGWIGNDETGSFAARLRNGVAARRLGVTRCSKPRARQRRSIIDACDFGKHRMAGRIDVVVIGIALEAIVGPARLAVHRCRPTILLPALQGALLRIVPASRVLQGRAPDKSRDALPYRSDR